MVRGDHSDPAPHNRHRRPVRRAVSAGRGAIVRPAAVEHALQEVWVISGLLLSIESGPDGTDTKPAPTAINEHCCPRTREAPANSSCRACFVLRPSRAGEAACVAPPP